jgi:hypothetical protein
MQVTKGLPRRAKTSRQILITITSSHGNQTAWTSPEHDRTKNRRAKRRPRAVVRSPATSNYRGGCHADPSGQTDHQLEASNRRLSVDQATRPGSEWAFRPFVLYLTVNRRSREKGRKRVSASLPAPPWYRLGCRWLPTVCPF